MIISESDRNVRIEMRDAGKYQSHAMASAAPNQTKHLLEVFINNITPLRGCFFEKVMFLRVHFQICVESV